MPKKVEKKKEESKISFQIKKELPSKYNEAYENTLNNIFALSAFTVKNYGRMGYQIKLLEQILDELKKLNKGK